MLLSALLLAPLASGQQTSPSVTLEEALRTARERQPQLRQARSATEVARAAAAEARAPLLPQASLSASYERTTANFFQRPGMLPPSVTRPSPSATASWKTFNFFNGGATVNQLIWDFDQTADRWRAAKVRTDAQKESERTVASQVALSVRSAYFAAWTDKSLVGVAQETLRNFQRHLLQTEGFVQAGTAPEIDLAQARANVATAKAQLIAAENAYLTAKAQLSLAVGWKRGLDYDVTPPVFDAVEGEDAPVETLEAEALARRPELAALRRQVDAQHLTVRAIQGAYAPTLAGSVSATTGGITVKDLGWNVAAGVSLSWQVFQGGLTRAQVQGASATASQLEAQFDQEHLQVRFELEQARLAILAAKATLRAQQDAVLNARERLRLAQGRYSMGVGSGIELGDAQVALSNAEAQWVQAQGQLFIARAQLLFALGHG
ncbi:outer membrane efflux protein [Myxococcus hansupus]|uniref:Outer membrane efflux protein n=1 Tax=Pseudomyxococcus hansupus TaxID=1297742 RepID=A0A0H4WKX5_9BACT|nr:outer membrane efflux protein [Myxococcus hansupus]